VYHRNLSLFIFAEDHVIRRFAVLAVGAGWLFSMGCGGDDSGGGGGFLPDGGIIPIDDDAGTGAACRNSKDCPTDQVCDPTAHACVQCVSNSDCMTGLVCMGSRCQAPAAMCMNSLDCTADPKAPICDSSTGKCVGCVVAKDCPTSNDCIDHACKAFTMCANSLDCPSGQVCDTTRQRCVECVGTNDCPMTSKCVGNVCRAKCTSDTMCTAMGQLCDLGQGICVQCIAANDCKPDQFCSGGMCVADVCNAGSTSCMANAVVTCRADGSGYGSPVSCGSQVCVPSATSASCKDHLCTPSVTACSSTGEQVIKCATDGLSQTVQDDCAGKGQVCVAAQCVAGVCSPGKRYCAGNEARQCSVKGDTYTVVQTCSGVTDYCDAATGTCKPKACTAGQPACNGRIKTTCNADGSGFEPGGTDCSPKYCSGGACVDYLFHEDFEDGDLVGWSNGTGSFTRAVTNVTAAAGTAYSLNLAKTGSTANYTDGIYQVFGSPLAPSSVSWYARATSVADYAGVFTLYSSSTVSSTYQIVRVYFSYNGYIILYDYTAGTSVKTYTSGTWYHFELRNINWTNRTFDFYIDGTPIKLATSFYGTGNSIARIELGDYYLNDAAYFDQIDFLP
jgi:hypothetical protein